MKKKRAAAHVDTVDNILTIFKPTCLTFAGMPWCWFGFAVSRGTISALVSGTDPKIFKNIFRYSAWLRDFTFIKGSDVEEPMEAEYFILSGLTSVS